jgi:hypothetical protein
METNSGHLSAPSLPSSLSSAYRLLDEASKRLFNKVFMWMWNYVRRKVLTSHGVLNTYWIVDAMRIKHDLCASELSMLTFLYHITDGGKRIVSSQAVYNGLVLPHLAVAGKTDYLHRLRVRGFLIRSSRDISAPYLQRSIARQKIFIQLTPKAVGLIKDIDRRVQTLIMTHSLNDLIGVETTKKGDT